MKQLSFDEFLSAQEAAEVPYRNGLNELLPWEEEDAVRPADTKLALLAIDALPKRGMIRANSIAKRPTKHFEDRPRQACPFFDGKNYEIEKRQGVKVKQDSGWRQLKS